MKTPVLSCVLSMSLLLASSVALADQQGPPPVLKGDMPLWRLLTSSKASARQIEALCKGGTNALELGKCLERELTTTSASDPDRSGAAFVDYYGNFGAAVLEQQKDSHKGRKALDIALIAGSNALFTYTLTHKFQDGKDVKYNDRGICDDGYSDTTDYCGSTKKGYTNLATGGIAAAGNGYGWYDLFHGAKTDWLDSYELKAIRVATTTFNLTRENGVPIIVGTDVKNNNKQVKYYISSTR